MTLLAGDRAPEREFGPITRTHIVRYAGAGGDFNPIHHDETFAVGAGYPSVLGHGLLTAGILATFVEDWLGRENLRRFTVRYVDQVWPGDTLVVDGVVDGADAEALRCSFTVRSRDGMGAERVVLTGAASATRPATGEETR